MKHGTRQRFFRQSLLQQLLTMLVPLLLFSAISISIVSQFTTQEADTRNTITLQHVRQNFELVLNQMDVLFYGFEQDGEMLSQFRDIVEHGGIDPEKAKQTQLLESFLTSVASANPYIESVYVYLDNEYDWVLTSTDGLVKVEDQFDVDWLDSYLNNKDTLQAWTERRPLYRYAFQRINPPQAVTLYRTIRDGSGVIVMNTLTHSIQQQMAAMCEYEGQVLLILNERDELMVLSDPEQREALSLLLTTAKMRTGEEQDFTQKHLRVTSSRSLKYGLRFVSMTPEGSLYALSQRLLTFSILALSGAALVGIVLAYQYGHRNYRRLLHVYDTFTAASNNLELPPLPKRSSDEYNYITQNMLNSFIQQSQLAMRLEKENYRLMSMELLALQGQINPHFLVNTLRTIFWKSMALTDGEMNGVSEMLENLTLLLDFSLGSPKETVTLAQELEATRSYVDIQRIRHQGQIVMRYDLPDVLLDARMHKLLLQPLVENAISHGFSADRSQLHITIRVRSNGRVLLFSVTDNGQGMTEERLAEMQALLRQEDASFEHIGLYNTNKRIQLYYGITDCLRLESAAGKGTRISFQIPVIDETE